MHIRRVVRADMIDRGLVAYPSHVIRGFGLLLGEEASDAPAVNTSLYPAHHTDRKQTP